MEFEVTLLFDAFIRRVFETKPLIRDALLRHERKVRCVQATCDQIRRGELSNIGRRLNTDRIRSLVEGCASIFCDAALRHMEEQALSSAERQRRTTEAGYLDQLKDEFREMSEEATSTRLVSRPGDVAR